MGVTDDHWLAGAGIFRNRLARPAGYAYLGKEWAVGKVLVGGIAGMTHHYNFNNGGLVPLGGLLVTVPLTDGWDLDMIGIPRIGGYTYTTLHFALRWRFRLSRANGLKSFFPRPPFAPPENPPQRPLPPHRRLPF